MERYLLFYRIPYSLATMRVTFIVSCLTLIFFRFHMEELSYVFTFYLTGILFFDHCGLFVFIVIFIVWICFGFGFND